MLRVPKNRVNNVGEFIFATLEEDKEEKNMSIDYMKVFTHAFETQSHGELGEHNVPCLVGDPGVGKNQLLQEWAKDHNYKVTTLLLANQDSLDVGGMWAPDFEANELKHMITPMFTGPIPEGYDGEIIELDEIGNAQAEVQTAFLSILETRKHENIDIPSNRVFSAATNKADTGCGGGRMLNSLQARLLQINVEPDADKWIEWAIKNDVYRPIISFINFSKESLNDFDPKATEFGQPNPRSWHKLSALLKKDDSPESRSLYAGAKVGQATAAKFAGFCQLDGELPTVDEILAHPDEAILPAVHVASQYAIVSNLAFWLTSNKGTKIPKESIEAMITYLRRMQEPLAVFGFRMLRQASEDFSQCSAYGEFVADFQDFDL